MAGLDLAVARGFPSATPLKCDHTHERYLELMGLAAEGGKSEHVGVFNNAPAFGYMIIHVAAVATTENSLR